MKYYTSRKPNYVMFGTYNPSHVIFKQFNKRGNKISMAGAMRHKGKGSGPLYWNGMGFPGRR